MMKKRSEQVSGLRSAVSTARRWFRPNLDAAELLQKEERRLRQLCLGLPIEPRAKVQGGLAVALVGEPVRIETPKGTLSFAVFGQTSAQRAKGLLTKQPATIAWIDTFPPDSLFWDIGANVGAYTLYAALTPSVRVVAFEPAAVNYFLLTANCELNALGERVDCLQLGVGGGKSVGHLETSQFEPGSSFSFSAKGRRPPSSRQAALILSVDELMEEFAMPCPNYIKIDVPGLTEAIVEGGERTFQRPELRGLHIETSEDSSPGRRIVARLARHGFEVTGRHVRGATDLTFTKQG
jgi:FkbM family methyltransferase